MKYTIELVEETRYCGRSGVYSTPKETAQKILLADDSLSSILKAIRSLMNAAGRKTKIHWMSSRIMGTSSRFYYEIGIRPSPNIHYSFHVTPVYNSL